jgi:hypothetical protein
MGRLLLPGAEELHRSSESSLRPVTLGMTLDRLFALVERLRKESIGEPILIKEKHVYEYREQLAAVVAILKLVRAAQGVTSLILLCRSGLFVDLGVIVRCVHDCEAEIYFLLEDFPKASPHVDQFVKAFFENTIDGYLSTETPPVPTKKIRSAMVRVLKGSHDHETSERVNRVYKTYSGYVHANYSHIMETYNGRERDFSLKGVPSDRQRSMRMEAVQLSANSVAFSAAFIARRLGLEAVHKELTREAPSPVT